MSATTSTQTPMVSGDASSGSSVVAKKSAVVSADSIANKSQKGIVGGGEVNGVSGMKEKKINLKVAPRRQSSRAPAQPTKCKVTHLHCTVALNTSTIEHHVSDIHICC